jgi:RNA polymerase sigma factor (sigma-70 family)
MDTKNSPISVLPQNEWDALIISILTPFIYLCSKDKLITVEDLRQEAWVGLLGASRRYDPNKGKFVTYAYHCVRGHIMRYIFKRTSNKPVQLDEKFIDVDKHVYIDNGAERNDLVQTIIRNVKDEEHYDLLVKHFMKGLSFRKLAKEYGVSHETIHNRVNKLLDLLEIRLNNENA